MMFSRTAVTLALAGFSLAAHAQQITGAGGTFPAPVYAKWGEAAKAAIGVELNYQAIGSGGGQNQITNRTVDFGASDAPMDAAKLMAANLLQFPTVMGAVVVIVNLPNVKPDELKLSGDVVAAIYDGVIEKWNDPKIATLNPGVALPSTAIAPVYRAEASGTSFVFTSYMSTVSPEWKSKVGAGTSVKWPTGSGAKGNDGVAATVKSTTGGIGYVEYAFAKQNQLTTTQLRNKSGAFVKPTTAAFTAAASAGDWAGAPNFAVSLLDTPGATAWPIVSPTFVLLPKDPKDAARSAAVIKFFDWTYKSGGAMAQQLDYIPLPAAVQDTVRAAWRSQVMADGSRSTSSLQPAAGPVSQDVLAATPETTPAAAPRPRGSGSLGDAVFAGAARASGVLVLVLLGAIIVVLFLGALQAFRAFGLGFLTSDDWDPVQDIYGALVPIYGTLASAVAAVVIAVPLAFGIAFFLTEMAPQWLRRPVGTAVELLAAVPSIIFGMWGFYVIVPLMAQGIEPWATDALGDAPGIGWFFSGPSIGRGILTAGFILAVMIIPFIAATMRDVFQTVPPMFKESAYGVGCTRWEVMRSVVLPYTRVSVVGGIMLGLGRALGETMAVTFVIGNTNRISYKLFAPGNTIASLVALEFPESPAGSLKLSSLLALGFILFVISFIVLFISRLLLRPRAHA